jgi:subtilisin family serine protease
MRKIKAVSTVGVSVGLLAALLAVLAPGGAGALSTVPTSKVIILLKNQERSLPATRSDLALRRSALARTQSPLSAQLTASGALDIYRYTLINAISATVSPAEEATLRSNPAVREVIADQVIATAPTAATSATAPSTSTSLSRSAALARGSAAERSYSQAAANAACSHGGATQLNPEALSLIKANNGAPGQLTAAGLGITGAGVRVGFIADGLDINNPDFIRPNGSHVFFDYKDFSGEGTAVPEGGEEAFGDASSIAAQGDVVYNVAGFGPHAVANCSIRIEGVAPGASLTGLDIFGAEDAGYNTSFLEAIDYAVVVDHVNVLNESLGNNFYPDDSASLDVIKAANDAAVGAGVTVVTSSGDAGVTSTIGTPATDPKVISAGATTSYRTDLEDGYGGSQFPGVTGYLDNNISSFSSSGYEQNGHTLDVVAPGEINFIPCSTDTAQYGDCTNFYGNASPIIQFGGTSESAPLTAGVAALVIQAYNKTHGTNPSPAVVKQIITSTATNIGAPADQQGAGLVNAYKAVLAAESYKAAGVGETLLNSASQLNVVAQPGTAKTLSDTITNNGADPQKISISSRKLGAFTSIASQTVTLSDTTSPETTDYEGYPSNYQKVTFRVPAGKSRLSASIAFQNSNTSLDARVRLTLVNPSGDLASYSVPQGDGNYGNVQVTNPKAGLWTGYIWSRTAAYGGSNGPVLFGAAVASYEGWGSISPSSVTLAPGKSAKVTLHVTTPTVPGDSDGQIVLSSNHSPQSTSIPVTLRSLIPSGSRSFTQTLSGGNGRSVITGQTFYYQLPVKAKTKELNAAIQLFDDPDNPFSAFLVTPSGEAVAYASNEFSSETEFNSELGAQLHVWHPASGMWTLIVAFIPAVSGSQLAEPFTVSTSDTPVAFSSKRLPDSTKVELTRGKQVTYWVKVTNNGSTPEQYFTDARLGGIKAMHLVSVTAPGTTVPLNFTENVPVYLVPTDTTGLKDTASTTGSTPIQFDSASPGGDPDFGSPYGSSVSASFSAAVVSQGEWDIAPTVADHFKLTGAESENVTTTMVADSAPFDPWVSSPTGDLWQFAVNPNAINSLSPTVVGPGRSAMIPVTFKPEGRVGLVVRGTLYLDDYNNILFGAFDEPNANQLAALSYTYKVK